MLHRNNVGKRFDEQKLLTMDKEFLKQYPTHMTQGLYQILDKLETEENIDIRAKLFGQLALGLEGLKSRLENYEDTRTVVEAIDRQPISE